MIIYDINGNVFDGTSSLQAEAVKLGLHLMPKTFGELNIVKRARQFTDIKWTPAVDLKRRNVVEYDQELNWSQGWTDKFLANTEYKGIPYSHGYYSGGYRSFGMVGYEVSIDAFATSAQFADSYLCSTDYWNQTSGIYTTYGATCDTLACYALGLSTWYGSDAGYQTLVNNGTIVKVCDGDSIEANINSIHLGDILWKKGVHVAVITDVVTDDNDIYIEVSEATTKGSTHTDDIGAQKGGVCRRELWSIADFFTRFYGYTVYRYRDSANVTYKQSRFVTLDGESPLHNLHDNMPLIPYMGDTFEYKSGNIPNTKVLIGTDDYAYLAVYKDGELFNTFTVNSASDVTVGFSATGAYEAFLFNSSDGTIANMTNRTVSTTWSVVS